MALSADQFRLVDRIFREAGTLPRANREAFVSSRANDPAVRDEVLALLEHDDRSSLDLESPPLEGVLADYRARIGTPVSDGESLPDRIGSYRILRRLGEGGFGVVFLAEQENPRRQVALKVLRSPFVGERLLRRFEHEAQILGRLQHPGIAQIFEAGTAEIYGHRQAFLAMEHVRGRSIRDYCDAAGDPPRKLGTRERLDLFAKVLDALQHAHGHGIVHRDIKPENILVVEAGNEAGADSATPQPKILDFGVARVVTDDSSMTTMATGVGQLVGTLPYMSPEQVLGDSSAIDTRSDIYSAGVVLYELLTGRLPHEIRDRSILDATRAIREDEPTPLSARNRALRGDIQTIVGKALEKDKTRRYQTAAELAEEIRRYLRGEPIAAKRDSQWYMLRKTMRRYRVAVAVISGFFVVVTGALIVSLNALHKANIARAAADAATIDAKSAQTRAEHRFGQVREIAHQFLFDFYDQIRTLPGATEARRKLVDTATHYVESLAADAADNPDLQIELAEAYRKIGDAQGWPGLSNLGNSAAARESYARALETLDKVDIARSGLEKRVARARMVVQLHDADLLQHIGLLEEARPRYRSVIATLDSALVADPDDNLVQEASAVARVNYAATLTDGDNLQERFEVLETAEKLLLLFLETRPDAKELRLQLAHCRMRLARTCYQRMSVHSNEPERAANYFNNGIKIVDTLIDADSHNTELRLMRCSAMSGLVDIFIARRELDLALATSLDVLNRLEDARRADPADRRAVQMVDAGLDQLADVYERRGETEKAFETTKRNFALTEELARDNPTHSGILRIAVKAERLGRLSAQRGDASGCRRYYDRAMEIWLNGEFEDVFTGYNEWRRNLIGAYMRYATALRTLGDFQAAVELIRRADDPYGQTSLDSGDDECLASAAYADCVISGFLLELACDSPTATSWRAELAEEAVHRAEMALDRQLAADGAGGTIIWDERIYQLAPERADQARAVLAALHQGPTGVAGVNDASREFDGHRD